MSYVLSFYRGHDSSVALVGEGRIIHLEMERFTRKKHDGGAVDTLITQAVKQAGISADDIVAVAGLGCSDDLGCETKHTRPAWSDDIGGMNAIDPCEAGVKALGRTYPCYYMPHHVGHAAYSFYTSQAESARVIVVDGGGDAWDSKDGSPLWVIDAIAGTISQPFGSSECKWDMQIVPQLQIGGRWNDLAEQLFGSWHCAGSVMALGGVPIGEHLQEPVASTIRTLQDDTTRDFHNIANELSKYPTIVLGGGCALNGIAAYSLLKRDDVNAVHVPPAVHDGGMPVGAAMMVLHRVLGIPRIRYYVEDIAFCGYGDESLGGGESWEEIASKPPIDEIVGRLVKGKVVALAYGQAESGPRALGHRSFLADPRAPGIKDRLNRIKGRQPWRPVAPVILPEYAGHYFDIIDPSAYDFMTMICTAKPRALEELPQAIHTDGTARVQVCREWPLDVILQRFYEATGCPALLNTSFNCAGEAIANDATQARDTFKRSGADCLVIGNKMEVG